MSDALLTQSRLHAGVWDVMLHHTGTGIPDLKATCEGHMMPDLSCRPGDNPQTWRISLPIPAQILNDGLQTVVLSLGDGTTLGSLAILAGEPLADDLRAEISLLRSELDLLKSAVRRLHADSRSSLREV